MSNVITVNFRDDILYAVEVDGEIFVVLKPICVALDVQWHGQRERIRRDAILNEGCRMIRLPSAGGDQDTLCLRLGLVNGWLFGIDAGRVKEASRERVLSYKRECYDVLFAHFYRKAEPASTRADETGAHDEPFFDEGEAITAPPSDDATLPPLRMVAEARKTHGVAAARELWVELGLPVTPAMRVGALPSGTVRASAPQTALVGRFLRACTTSSGSRHAGVRSGDLFRLFEAWAGFSGEAPCGHKVFGEAMKHLGWVSRKSSVIYWPGLALSKAPEDFIAAHRHQAASA